MLEEIGLGGFGVKETELVTLRAHLQEEEEEAGQEKIPFDSALVNGFSFHAQERKSVGGKVLSRLYGLVHISSHDKLLMR